MRRRKRYLGKSEFEGVFEQQTAGGIAALLRAFPKADAYWLAYDTEVPTFLRRQGRLVLAEALIEAGGFWVDEAGLPRALLDLPHAMQPLGRGGTWRSRRRSR